MLLRSWVNEVMLLAEVDREEVSVFPDDGEGCEELRRAPLRVLTE